MTLQGEDFERNIAVPPYRIELLACKGFSTKKTSLYERLFAAGESTHDNADPPLHRLQQTWISELYQQVFSTTSWKATCQEIDAAIDTYRFETRVAVRAFFGWVILVLLAFSLVFFGSVSFSLLEQAFLLIFLMLVLLNFIAHFHMYWGENKLCRAIQRALQDHTTHQGSPWMYSFHLKFGRTKPLALNDLMSSPTLLLGPLATAIFPLPPFGREKERADLPLTRIFLEVYASHVHHDELADYLCPLHRFYGLQDNTLPAPWQGAVALEEWNSFRSQVSQLSLEWRWQEQAMIICYYVLFLPIQVAGFSLGNYYLLYVGTWGGCPHS